MKYIFFHYSYTPLLLVMGLMSIVAWSILYWSNANNRIELVLVFYAFFRTFRVPFFAYSFARVTTDHYSTVSALTHAAIFAGSYIGMKLPQMIEMNEISIEFVFYSVFAAQIVATFTAICLPRINRIQQSSLNPVKHCVWMIEQLNRTYRNSSVMIWSIWFIIGTVIFNQFVYKLMPMYLKHIVRNSQVSLKSIFNRHYELISMAFLTRHISIACDRTKLHCNCGRIIGNFTDFVDLWHSNS